MIISSPDKSQDSSVPPQALATEAVLPGPPESAPKLPKKIRRRPIRLAAYALVLLSLAFVVHSSRRHDRDGRRPPKVFMASHPPFPQKKPPFTPARLANIEKTFMYVVRWPAYTRPLPEIHNADTFIGRFLIMTLLWQHHVDMLRNHI